jgi:hypothetical protein
MKIKYIEYRKLLNKLLVKILMENNYIFIEQMKNLRKMS